MKKTALLAGVTGLTLAALAAFASPRGGGPCSGPGFGPRFGAALGLTGDQQAKFEALREECSKDTAPLRSKLFDKKQELQALWAAPAPDAAAIRAKQKELSALRDQMQDRMVQCRIEQRAILTPDQQQKLSNLREHRGHRGGGCGDCGGGGDCGGMGGKERGSRGHDCEQGRGW